MFDQAIKKPWQAIKPAVEDQEGLPNIGMHQKLL
jgi:hypothetical protein